MSDHDALYEASIDGAMNSIRFDIDGSVEGAFLAITLDWDWNDKDTARTAHYQAHESADNNATKAL
jgi:hypothetical protein